MALYISTGDGVDGVVGYIAINLYWGRCGRVCRCRSLHGRRCRERPFRSLLGRCGRLYAVDFWDGVVDYGAVDLYWGRCGRV